MSKPTKIKPGQEFMLGDTVFTYSLNEDQSINIIKSPQKTKESKAFVPPTQEEVKAFFDEKGYVGAISFYDYYANGTPAWTDKEGTPVRSWKQKAIAVWMKPERKVAKHEDAPKTTNPSGLSEGMVI